MRALVALMLAAAPAIAKRQSARRLRILIRSCAMNITRRRPRPARCRRVASSSIPRAMARRGRFWSFRRPAWPAWPLTGAPGASLLAGASDADAADLAP